MHLSLLTIGTETLKEKIVKVSEDYRLIVFLPVKTIITSCNTEGSVPPSLNLPQPVTVAFSPIRRSSVAGRQMGEMCAANVKALSSRTSARSYSYVKKLYLGCTTFLATPRST